MAASQPHGLFAVSSLGLGHATRTLPIILDFLRSGWRIHIVSSGNALNMLRRELACYSEVSFREMADYPALERGCGWRMYWYLLVDLLKTWRVIRLENRYLKRCNRGYDLIFSDGRYGFYSPTSPSFILTHQIAFVPPRLLEKTFWLTRRFNLLALRKFDTIFIPDFPDKEGNLSGKLSHSKLLQKYSHRHIGILSSYRKIEVNQDVDYLFIISGYLVEHKEDFLRKMLQQAKTLPGKKVFILGQKDGLPDEMPLPEGVEIHPMVEGELRQQLFSRARMVIARAGYTTVMDLVEHGKRGVLIPTPNQTEQEYLAAHLGNKKYFSTSTQCSKKSLKSIIEGVKDTTRCIPPWRTEDSVGKIKTVVEAAVHKRFISIIVPAHNESKEIRETLQCLIALDYPADRFEIIVVENGSSDNTFEIAQKYAKDPHGKSIAILQSNKGVSTAKNKGLAHISSLSEWVVFCDADTHLGPLFLRQLNTRISRCKKNVVVGTCSIQPRPAASMYAWMWFRLFDHIHRFTKTPYSLQIARSDLACKTRFNQEVELAEDLQFIKTCCERGKFFFLQTNQVLTSTRRFAAFGYLRLSLRWAVGALLPLRFIRNWKYDVVR